ncbi:YceI family protein [Candidatus Sulfurimonas baltica]|uniref:YceI family protein n=1 Tax=Candidatus Sulfurimonas baltica TaxID=2740404 RepID=A0A7S7LW06_9BACT|nr:YceI family protein [Candidatus Sulfurimonas baltica]QOY51873.1 YceI family protein [Candidatus Sulfurimonas baltica]
MKKIILIILLGISLLNAKVCKLTQLDEIEFSFSGYKTIYKVPMNATFTSFEYKPAAKEGNTLKALLVGATLIVDKKSVKSSDGAMDETLSLFFFDKLKGDEISAEILDVKMRNSREGTLSVKIGMNGVEKIINMKYYIMRNSLSASGNINILDFDAKDLFSSFSKECFDKHLGKTWSDVTLFYKIKKVCKTNQK